MQLDHLLMVHVVLKRGTRPIEQIQDIEADPVGQNKISEISYSSRI